jgi:hypothetical protein
VKKIHFYLGNVFRFLTIWLFQKKIHPSQVRTIFGSSFGKDGWHHLIKTLEEYDSNPSIHYKQTSLYSFLKNFSPNSICELLDDNLNCDNLPLFNYPWGTFRKNEYFSTKNPLNSRFCGPSENSFIKEEFHRTISLYKEIKKSGYKPWKYGNTFIGGTFLINREGETRFIVLQGNHRLAILSHLNYNKIAVRNVPGYIAKIFEKNLDQWSLVKKCKCSSEMAHKVFSLFFKENGTHILKLLKN